jgi:hypothetical protein
LHSFILVFLRVFLWSKHIIYNTCNFQIVMQFVINVQFFFIRYYIS